MDSRTTLPGSNPISVINYLGNPRQGVLPECLYFLWLWNGGGTLNTCLPTLEDELVSHKISAVTMGISHTQHYSYCYCHHHYSASIHREFLHLFFSFGTSIPLVWNGINEENLSANIVLSYFTSNLLSENLICAKPLCDCTYWYNNFLLDDPK